MGVNEQEQLIEFMDAGNAVYLSGVSLATDHNGTEFWNRFGASLNSIQDDIPGLMGETGSFAEGLHFEYQNTTDAGQYNDVITENGGETVIRSMDSNGRVIINSNDTYRTIASSILLGAIPDQFGVVRKENLMRLYLSHLLDINQPQFWSSDWNIDLPNVVPGGIIEHTIYIQNTGQYDLELTDITLVGENFTISESDDISLSFGDSQAYTISFNPADDGVFTGNISITTNDPEHESVMIGLIGNSVGVPIMNLDPGYINAGAVVNGTDTEILTISNVGGGYLDYHLDFVPVDELEYYWKDSNMADGPEFIWNDISSIGTNLELGGLDSYVTIDLPFPFVFYGQEKTEMKVSTNGYLTFGIDGTDYSNDIIPGSLQPDDLIAAFWDDLRSTSSSNAYSWFDEENEKFVIQYTNWQVNVSGGEGDMNFQIHLYANGDIYFYYQNMDGRLTSATVGIENYDHTVGTLVVYNDDYLENNLAVKISHNQSWLSLGNHLGTVDFGESEEIQLNFDATGLEVGNYSAIMAVYTNEETNVLIHVAISFVVGSTYGGNNEVPALAQLNQNYPNPFNPVTTISFEITSGSFVELEVYSAKGQKIKTLVNENLSEGIHNIEWNGTDNKGNYVASGIYFYKMKSGKYTSTKKMLLMK